MRPGQAACYIEAPLSPQTIAAIAISIFVPQLAIFSNQLFGSVVAGFLSGAVSSGSLQGGLAGAFSAGLFFGIGKAPWTSAAEGSKGFLGSGLTAGAFGGKIVAHGMAGGVMAKLQGGNFGAGFAGAGFAQAFSPLSGRASTNAGRVVSSALVGGTASVLSGGKFANGAVTGAFVYAFNHLASSRREATTTTLSDKEANAVFHATSKYLRWINGLTVDEMFDNFPEISEYVHGEGMVGREWAARMGKGHLRTWIGEVHFKAMQRYAINLYKFGMEIPSGVAIGRGVELVSSLAARAHTVYGYYDTTSSLLSLFGIGGPSVHIGCNASNSGGCVVILPGRKR